MVKLSRSDLVPSMASALAREIGSSKSGECPYVMFLGAGASVSSGIPTASQLVEDWQMQIYCGLYGKDFPLDDASDSNFLDWVKNDYMDWFEANIGDAEELNHYSALFEFLRQSKESRQSFIEDLVSGDDVRPSPGYVYLSGLMVNRFVDCVLTTNFDELVSDALFTYFYARPIICAFESSIGNFNNSSIRPKVIKLHGDYLFNDIRNTDSEVIALDANMENKMIELCQDRGLVVIGYGGNDESIMNPIMKQMQVNPRFLTKHLHWCVTRSKDDKIDIPKRVWELKKRFPRKVHIYEISNFDDFFCEAFAQTGEFLDGHLREAMTRSAPKSFKTAVNNYRLSNALPPQMVKDRSIANRCLSNLSTSWEDEIDVADDHWEHGTILRDKKSKFKEAILEYQKGIDKTEEILGNEGLPDALMLRCLSRKMGCLIGKAKSLHKIKKSTKSEMQSFKDTVKLARNSRTNDWTEAAIEKYLSILYNAICGYCVSSSLTKSDYSTIENDIGSALKELKTVPQGDLKIVKLKDDSDIAPFKKLIKWD